MDRTIKSRRFAARAKGQFACGVWSSSRSLQYQSVKPAPAPRDANRAQGLTCHIPHSSPIPVTSQKAPLTEIYNGPGELANSSNVRHHRMVVTRRKAPQPVRLNTSQSKMVTLKGRFIIRVPAKSA